MKSSLSQSDLAAYTARQIAHFFPDGAPLLQTWDGLVAKAMTRVERCFRQINQGYYRDASGGVIFNHLNTDQYAAYLYLLSNTAFRDTGDISLAAKLYALNKALHSLDVFYEVDLPEVFAFVHPVGTVIGRAVFGNYLCVYQNCTIGGDLEGNHPTLGEGVVLFGGSRVLGSATVGSNCLLSSGTIIIGESAPDDSTVFGVSPNLTCKPAKRRVRHEIFGLAEC